MNIRKAVLEDANNIARYIVLAMDDIIYKILGNISEAEAIEFMTEMVAQESNQYSFTNAWILEDGDHILGAAVVYDGGELAALRQPMIAKIKSTYGRVFTPDDETQAGEYYIDTVGINPDFQGKGLGTTLFQFLIEEYVHSHQQTLGLLVDKDNPKAKALYLRLGFEFVNDVAFAGKTLEHLQYKCI